MDIVGRDSLAVAPVCVAEEPGKSLHVDEKAATALGMHLGEGSVEAKSVGSGPLLSGCGTSFVTDAWSGQTPVILVLQFLPLKDGG